jgi:hypothetical protein
MKIAFCRNNAGKDGGQKDPGFPPARESGFAAMSLPTSMFAAFDDFPAMALWAFRHNSHNSA